MNVSLRYINFLEVQKTSKAPCFTKPYVYVVSLRLKQPRQHIYGAGPDFRSGHAWMVNEEGSTDYFSVLSIDVLSVCSRQRINAGEAMVGRYTTIRQGDHHAFGLRHGYIMTTHTA